MTELTAGLRSPLSRPRIYSAIQRALGAEKVRETYVSQYLSPRTGERLLDLGCGTGEILAHLPPTSYLGIDISAAYVAAARARFGERAEFRQDDVCALQPHSAAPFEAVMSIGVLHHLSDDDAHRLLSSAAAAMAASGRLVTIDPAVANEQARIARWLIERDRGRCVREATGYAALAQRHFGRVRTTVRHDLARVPYTHVILECRDPKPG